MSDDFKAKLAMATGKSEEKESSTSRFQSKRTQTKAAKAPSIKDNPFAQIAMSTPDPQAQKEAMVKLMTYVDAETTAKNNKALEEYSASLQSERQRLAVELIEMTDTKTFSNMQRVLRDINDGVLDFEEQIKPFMEIINAVRLIQAEDATTDILSEMREDKKKHKEMQAKISAFDQEIKAISAEIMEKLNQMEKLKDERSFFGFGDIKQSAKDAMAALRVEIDSLKAKQDELKTKKKATREQHADASSKFEHLKEAKEIMGTMLNLSEGEHEARHEKLVTTAAGFVTTTKERVTETLDRSLQMGDQIKSLSDLAFTMRGNYSVLSEAAKEAEVINSQQHETLKKELDSVDDPLEKMNKERISRDLSKHITTLNDAASETTDVISDLTISSQRIETMEAANVAQIKKTQQIQTSGIAGVADNLSSVLTAINQAAIGQASTAAQQSLRRMNTNTIELTKEQMLNAAKSRNDDNSELIKALEQLSGFGEVIEIANHSAQEAIGENREILSEMRRTADEVKRAATDTLEVTSNQITSELQEDQ
jgi:predicted  nucleic acid-binding Zn-ribbon protein